MAKGSPITALARGLIACAIGTLATDALWYRRYRADGASDSFPAWQSSDANSFDDSGAPAQVGKLALESVTDIELKPEAAGTTTNVVH